MAAVLKSKYLGTGRACYYNTNNLPDLAPLEHSTATDTLAVEAAQYDGWAATDALAILEREFKGGVVRVPGPVKRPEARRFADAPEWLIKVYTAINGRSNALHWWSELVFADGVVPIDNETSRLLAAGNLSQRAWLRAQFQTIIDSHPEVTQGWFVKCGTCSTKHQYPPDPVFSGAEAVVHLLGADPIIDALSKQRAKCFAMRPWDNTINSNNEFRVFVRDGRVTGVSQQACHSHVVNVVALFDPNDVVAAAQTCYDDAMAKLPPGRRMIHECTFDAYLTSPDGSVIVHMIEINGELFGWGPAGSSLFDWRAEPPPQPNEPAVVYITA